MTDPSPTYPHSWQGNGVHGKLQRKAPFEGNFWGGKIQLPRLGSPGVSLQDVGWDLNISQCSFLFPCPCQESGSARGFRITCPGKTGAGGGWNCLSQSQPGSTAPTLPGWFSRWTRQICAQGTRKVLFLQTLCWLQGQSLGWPCESWMLNTWLSPQGSLFALRFALLWCHWDMQNCLWVQSNTDIKICNFPEPFLPFLSASAQGNQCKEVEGVDLCDCSSACKSCGASDTEPKGRKKKNHPALWFLTLCINQLWSFSARFLSGAEPESSLYSWGNLG